MTIRHAGTWCTITSISLHTSSASVRHGAAIYVADAVDSAGNTVRIQLHNDEYGYRLRDRPTSTTSWSAPWQLRRAAPAFPNIR